MKKAIYACFLLTILLILNGCSNSKNTNGSIIDVNRGIEKIKMGLSFPFTKSIIIEDKEKIQEFVNYINDLDLKKTESKEGYLDGTYVINVFFDDNTVDEFLIFAGKYFEYGKYRYEITTEEAQKFLDFYYGMIKSES
jgi:hypothetical protein